MEVDQDAGMLLAFPGLSGQGCGWGSLGGTLGAFTASPTAPYFVFQSSSYVWPETQLR